MRSTRAVRHLRRRGRRAAAGAGRTAAPMGGPTRPDGPAWRPCGPCTPSRAVPAWPARCAWARWPTGWRPRSSGRPPRPGRAGHPGPLHQGVDQLAEEFARCAAAMPRRWRRAAGTAACLSRGCRAGAGGWPKRWWTPRRCGGGSLEPPLSDDTPGRDRGADRAGGLARFWPRASPHHRPVEAGRSRWRRAACACARRCWTAW
jgi:chemosensory pili system protein ChpA (sensor histidine kinase/response regulator)